MSPPSVSHVPSGHYSEHSPSQVSVPSLAPSYAVPTLGSQYIPQDTSRSRTGSTSTSYAEQVCAPRISHAYTAATTGKHRQSNDAVDTVDAAYYAKRPRNLSTSSYYTPRRSTDASLGQSLTDQAGRASWDFSAYLQSNPTSADPDSAQATQYRRESVAKQGNPQTYQYKQESTDLSKMQTQTSIKSEKR
ncbi:hypothetical protein MMC28_001440 [Mycoblastus sanguinarius]|nr:hypothetical protein [Mycoblastus sanguinarius]